MTIAQLERDVLSLRVWAQRAVLPTALALLLALLILRFIGDTPEALDHAAIFIALMAAWFVLVRGGHILMIRSLHHELKTKYPDAYAARLALIPSFRRRNAGFALARIKRDMIHDGTIPNPNADTDSWKP